MNIAVYKNSIPNLFYEESRKKAKQLHSALKAHQKDNCHIVNNLEKVKPTEPLIVIGAADKVLFEELSFKLKKSATQTPKPIFFTDPEFLEDEMMLPPAERDALEKQQATVIDHLKTLSSQTGRDIVYSPHMGLCDTKINKEGITFEATIIENINFFQRIHPNGTLGEDLGKTFTIPFTPTLGEEVKRDTAEEKTAERDMPWDFAPEEKTAAHGQKPITNLRRMAAAQGRRIPTLETIAEEQSGKTASIAPCNKEKKRGFLGRFRR